MKLINFLVLIPLLVGCSFLDPMKENLGNENYCSSDNLVDIHLLEMGDDHKEFIAIDIKKHFLEKKPKAAVVRVDCIGTPMVWSFKANTDYDNPSQKAIILYRAAFNLKVTIQVDTEEEIYLTKLSYKAKNLHDKPNFELTKNIESKLIKLDEI